MTDRPDAAARILTAALDAFASGGYTSASLTDIATAAECTKANVLYHYGSKQGVLDAALAPAIEAGERIRDAVRDGADPYRLLLDLVLDHPKAAELLLFHHATLPDPAVGLAILDLLGEIAGTIAPHDERTSARFMVAMIGLSHLLLGQERGEVELDPVPAFVALATNRDAAAALLREMATLDPARTPLPALGCPAIGIPAAPPTHESASGSPAPTHASAPDSAPTQTSAPDSPAPTQTSAPDSPPPTHASAPAASPAAAPTTPTN